MKSTQDGYRYRAVLNGSYFSNAFQELVSLETTSTVTCPDKVLPNELFNCTLTVTGLSDYGPRVRKPAGVVLWRDGPVLDPPDTTHCLGQPATRGCCELDLAGTCTLRFRAPATLGETRTVVTDYGTDWNPFRNYLLDQPSLGSASMVTASCAAPNITDVPEARTIATAPGECFGIMPDLRGELSVTERGCPAAVTQTPAPGTHLSAGQTLPVQFTATSGGGSVQSQSYVTIVDGSIPFITLYGDSVVNLECHQPYFEQGALASQLCSNQQPAQITQSNVDTGQPGTYFVTYGADYGPLGHPVATRVIHVTDSTAPVLSLVGPASMVSECGLYFDPGASAIDQCAGPVTPTLTILDQDGNAVATPSAGTFTYRYTASDFSGNVSSVDRTVELRDEIPPAIEPPGFPLPVLVQCRSALTLPTLLASDFCDGPVPVTTTTDADVNVPGNYTITYAARDTTGNQAQRPVPLTVTDNVKPVITLTGANPMTVECHTPFTDPGASALDACTGSLAVNASGTVDTNSVGTYTLSYSATDSSGNVQLLTRTVHVVDTTKPVIALNGANPISLECHSTYVEPGATATDACAGSFAATASASVNANVPGTYTVSYTATDGAGNAAIVVTRTVNVVDTTKPVISLNGSADVTIECHTAYVEAGATAVDACAASPTATPSGSVDSNTVGVYTVTYNATDPSGNVGTAVTRTVHVVDSTKPVITLTGANLITLECHTTFTDPGATALDACAGAVTVNATGTVNPNVPGTYTITYSATDSSGNTQSLTRTVDVVDTIRPSIVVTGANPLTLECHSSYADPGATSTDACSGALTVVTTGTVDANTPGSYTVTYSSVDGSGNTQTATRTVNVVDTTKPVVTLTGAASMNVECHTAFTDPGATATDDCDGAHPATATGVVDAQTPGTYTITYSAVDAAGNAATTVVRTVIVGDATPPVITLNGSASMTVECHTSFTDPGAVVDDTCGGQSAANVSGSVDANTVGTYTLTYAATDANGNNAAPVIRTIHVTDTTKPVITLAGSNPLTLECHTGYVEPGASATDSCAGTFTATVSGVVDPDTPGTYTVTYNAADPSGNSANAVTRTVIVTDTTRPVIAMNGSSELTVECHSSYTDAGATATDSCSGTLSVVTNGSVDANTPGTYVVTYGAADASGNTHSVARTVNVVDTTRPVVTLTGDATIRVECHTTFTDPGAIATDACDGTRAATAQGLVDANTPGTYTRTYSSNDAAGNEATPVIRTVIVGDAIAPVITLTGDASMTVECHTSFTDPGATATDSCSGSSSVATGGSVDVNTVGTYTLTYSATDASGNNATPVMRTVHVVDTTRPSITLTGSSDVTIECHTSYTDAGATASDSCAGNIDVIPSGSVDVNTVGTYTLTYTATDPSGNVQTTTRTIHVVDTTTPVIALTGNADVTVECHTPFTDPGATASDSCTGTFAAAAAGSLDVNTPGTYTLTYSATDASGNAATPVTRTVRVTDTTRPVVVLAGNSVMSVECHTAFTDPGASASDSCAGSLAVQTSGAVDANSPGTYTLSYTATDPSANSTTITRTVNVVDSIAPSIPSCPAAIVVPADANCGAAMPDFVSQTVASDSCSASVTVTQSPAAGTRLSAGTHTVTITATDPAGNHSACTTTFTVTGAPTTLRLDAPDAQYSDAIALTATIDGTATPVTGGNVTFTLDGVVVGTAPVTSSRATLQFAGATRRPDSYELYATYSGASCAAASAGTGSLRVNREIASLRYTGPTSLPNTETPIQTTLTAEITQDADNAPGDLTRAAILFQLFRGKEAGVVADLTVHATADTAGHVSAPVSSLVHWRDPLRSC